MKIEENYHDSSRNNNFNILRFIAAVFVIIGHMYYITGAVPFVVYGQAVSTIGVKILFLLSGYFITISYLSDDRPRHLIRYAVKRVFRIFPALIFVVVTSMVIGSFVSTLSFHDYWGSSQTWRYLNNILMAPRYDLLGVFTDNPYPRAVNGSLWTMPVELFMYVCVPLFCLFHSRFRVLPGSGIILLFFVVTALRFVLPAMGIARVVVYGTDWCAALAILPYYLAGCCYAVFRKYKRLWNIQLATLLMFLLSCSKFGYIINELFFLVIFSYFIFSFGCCENPLFAVCFRDNDISYGMYLWGFPVQQLLVHFFNSNVSFLWYVLMTVAIVIFLSYVSYVYVEKPMIASSRKLITKG